MRTHIYLADTTAYAYAFSPNKADICIEVHDTHIQVYMQVYMSPHTAAYAFPRNKADTYIEVH